MYLNPKTDKLRAERARNAEKIQALQARNEKLDEQILKNENADIIGMVRELELTPEQLAELLTRSRPILPKAVNLEEETPDTAMDDSKTEECKNDD